MKKRALSVILSAMLICSTSLTGCGKKSNVVAENPSEQWSSGAMIADSGQTQAQTETEGTKEAEKEETKEETKEEAKEETKEDVKSTTEPDKEPLPAPTPARTNNRVQPIPSTNPVVAQAGTDRDITNGSGEAGIAAPDENEDEEDIEHTEVCSHSYNGGVVEVNAGCTNSGSVLYTCTKCGSNYRSVIPATGHSLVITTVQPTCTQEGYKMAKCSFCGMEETLETYPASSHNYVVRTADLPTCTEGGKSYEFCSDCGSERTVDIPARGHSWSEWTVDIEATTEKEGQRSRSCLECGEKETESTPRHVHSYHVVKTVQPTCIKEGSTTYECTCGDSYEDVIPAAGHKCSWVVTKEPACTVAGEKSFVCAVCGEVMETAEVDAKGHGKSSWVIVKQPTCVEAGLEERSCDDCGAMLESRAIASKGHTPGSWVGTTAATCGAPGMEELHCVSCNEILSTREVPATGHNYKSESTSATCTTSGKTTYVCINCGDKYETEIPATGHVEGVYEIAKQPTCTEEGTRVKKCTVCGEVLLTESIPATGHTPGAWVGTSSATCGNPGTEEQRCKICDVVIGTREVSAVGHSYTEVVIPATCTEGGKTIHTCERCGDSYEDNIVPATGHNWTTNTVSSTCQTQGYTEKECTVCHKTTDKTVLELADHTPGEWVVTKEANCIVEGQKTRSCTVCGKTLDTETIPADGNHDWQVNKTVPPTACSTGCTTYRCTRCGVNEIRDTVPSGGKSCDYDWDSRKDLGDGTYLVRCKVCGGMDTITEAKYNDIVTTNTQVENKIGEVISQVIRDDMTDAEKVIAINNWLCRNVVYDDEEYQNSLKGNANIDSHSYKTPGALLDGLAVCGGYAYAFKDFMDALGIDCKYVASESMNHAWNQVRLEDGWYWVDATWNDTGKDSDFYNEYLFKTGKRADDEVGGVECNGEMYQGGKTVYDKYGVESKEDIAGIYDQYAGEETFYISCDFATNYNLMDSLNAEYKAAYGEDLSYSKTLIDGRLVICIKNSDNVREFIAGQATNGIMVMSADEAMAMMSAYGVAGVEAVKPETIGNADMTQTSGEAAGTEATPENSSSPEKEEMTDSVSGGDTLVLDENNTRDEDICLNEDGKLSDEKEDGKQDETAASENEPAGLVSGGDALVESSDEKEGGKKEQKNSVPAEAEIKKNAVLDESIN